MNIYNLKEKAYELMDETEYEFYIFHLLVNITVGISIFITAHLTLQLQGDAQGLP